MSQSQVRVFHLIKGLGRGGAERLLSLSPGYSNRSRFVYGYGYFRPDKGELAPQLRASGAEVSCFGARTAAGMMLRIGSVASVLERWGAQLLHCHLPLPGVVGRLAARRLGLPVVYTEHNRPQSYHPVTRRLNLWTWRLQTQVVAVSHDVASSIARQSDSTVPVQVIHNGVPTDQMAADPEAGVRVRDALDIAPHAVVVGQAAVFRRQKRLDIWLCAAAQIRRERPDVVFLLIGDGPARRDAEDLAARLGIGGAVHFTGLQEDVRPYLSACDLFLVASDWEGLPLAVLEAMALELPVVATAVGGIPEVIEDGVSGLLVPPGDAAALARAALRLIGDPEFRRSAGRAGRRRVDERFDMRRMVSELEALYLRVLDGGQGGGP